MNFSTITDDLFIGTTPSSNDYNQLRDIGVRLIINMRFSRGPAPDSHVPSISLLWLRSIDSPFFPISVDKLIRGAQEALAAIQNGGKVYTHCAYGRHRGVAMGASVLIAQGYAPDDAFKLITSRRSVADPYAYHIRSRILKFANQWKANT